MCRPHQVCLRFLFVRVTTSLSGDDVALFRGVSVAEIVRACSFWISIPVAAVFSPPKAGLLNDEMYQCYIRTFTTIISRSFCRRCSGPGLIGPDCCSHATSPLGKRVSQGAMKPHCPPLVWCRPCLLPFRSAAIV